MRKSLILLLFLPSLLAFEAENIGKFPLSFEKVPWTISLLSQNCQVIFGMSLTFIWIPISLWQMEAKLLKNTFWEIMLMTFVGAKLRAFLETTIVIHLWLWFNLRPNSSRTNLQSCKMSILFSGLGKCKKIK